MYVCVYMFVCIYLFVYLFIYLFFKIIKVKTQCNHNADTGQHQNTITVEPTDGKERENTESVDCTKWMFCVLLVI